jgi:hypothetical protein
MKKTIISLLAVLCAGAFAAELEFNGNFENATADKHGILWPRFWHKTFLSKETSVRLTKEPTEVHSGKFAFLVEQENEKSVANVRYLKSFPVGLKDKVKLTLYARGTGNLKMMRILYLGGTGKFLRTIGWGKTVKIDSPDKWVKLEFTDSFPALKAQGVPITSYNFIPVIHVTGEAELLIDDMKLEHLPAAAAVKK